MPSEYDDSLDLSQSLLKVFSKYLNQFNSKKQDYEKRKF